MQQAILESFQKTIKRLQEVLALRKDKITRDSAIMRFQLCFDLAWKAIKVYARNVGLECYSPKDCFQAAFQLKLIDYDQSWLRMIEDRNLIIHTYEEKTADRVYSKLSSYLKLLQQLNDKLSEVDKEPQKP